MFRIASFVIWWAAAIILSTTLALSDNDWAERLAERLGGEPDLDGRAFRFAVLCLGFYAVPVAHAVVFEIVCRWLERT